MSEQKAREQARKDLNPAEDVKGAVRYLKGMNPGEEVQEFMEKATEVLDPRRSDIRAVLPEEEDADEEQAAGEPMDEIEADGEDPEGAEEPARSKIPGREDQREGHLPQNMVGQTDGRQFRTEHPQKR